MKTYLAATLMAATWIFVAAPAFAEPDMSPGLPAGLEGYKLTGKTVTCVSVTRIRSTKVLNDDHIVFTMNGRKTYLNRLRSSCNGLRFEGSFSYKIPSTQLCRGEIITVLANFGPRGFCSLGSFEEVEKIKESAEAP